MLVKRRTFQLQAKGCNTLPANWKSRYTFIDKFLLHNGCIGPSATNEFCVGSTSAPSCASMCALLNRCPASAFEGKATFLWQRERGAGSRRRAHERVNYMSVKWFISTPSDTARARLRSLPFYHNGSNAFVSTLVEACSYSCGVPTRLFSVRQ